MRKIIPLLIVCLTSIGPVACLHRADSLRMLEVRADYDEKEQQEIGQLKLADGQKPNATVDNGPLRSAPKTAHIWIFPHETPSKEYFWGGWISVVVEGDHWQIESPLSAAPEIPNGIKSPVKTKQARKG